MILFATDYDEATKANRLIAETLISYFRTVLLGVSATREALHERLDVEEQPLYAMSHGKLQQLQAQNSVPAIEVSDIHLVAKRSTFAFACHTATILGGEVAAVGGAWWGYTGAIAAPPDNKDQQVILRPIFEFLVTFHQHQNPSSVEQFIGELKIQCLEAERKIGSDGDILEALYCIQNIWDRLRVWLPNKTEPILHPEASRGFLFN